MRDGGSGGQHEGMTPATDLRDWLGSLSAADLTVILELRPGALAGAPVTDLDELAERLAHPGTVAAALRELPTPLTELLETLAACGSGASVRRSAELLHASASDGRDEVHLETVAHGVNELVRAALVWPDRSAADDDAPPGWAGLTAEAPLVVNPGLLELVPVPWGLGRPAAPLVSEVPADSLTRVVRRWGLPVPTSKHALVRTVARHLGNAPAVRMILSHADPDQAQVLLGNASRAVRGTAPWATDVTGGGPPEDREEAPRSPRFDPVAHRLEQSALAWARDNGLAYQAYGHGLSTYGLQMPAEVVLALMPPEVRLPFHPVEPAVPTGPASAEQVRAAASGAVTDALALTMALLEAVDRDPPTLLRSGGVGAREIARTAKRLGAVVADVRLALELADALRLLDHADGERLRTSEAFRTWRRQEPAERAADLILAWVGLPLVPSRNRADDGSSRPALRAEWSSRAPRLRALVLDEVLELDGAGITSPEALADRVAWRLPYIAGESFREDVVATWAEAHHLGILALGALSEPMRVAVAGGGADDVVATLCSMLPGTRSTALFGSDLTVVVPGSPAHHVVDLLDAVAVREARGSAATWRVTPESVRGALDRGHDAEQVLAGLGVLAEGSLPQALEYLVRDVARRHGHLAVRAAGAVVIGEDPALVAEVAAHRSLRRIGLRPVAPTVLVTDAGPDDALVALRAAGYLPVPQDRDGAPVLALAHPPEIGRGGADAGTTDTDGAEAHGRDDDADAALRGWVEEARRQTVEAAPPESPAAAATRLLRGDPPAERPAGLDTALPEVRRLARRLSPSEARQLAHAVATGGAVQVRYRSTSGGLTDRVVSELTLVGGYLHAWCHLRGDHRYFALGNILSVAPT